MARAQRSLNGFGHLTIRSPTWESEKAAPRIQIPETEIGDDIPSKSKENIPSL